MFLMVTMEAQTFQPLRGARRSATKSIRGSHRQGSLLHLDLGAGLVDTDTQRSRGINMAVSSLPSCGGEGC